MKLAFAVGGVVADPATGLLVVLLAAVTALVGHGRARSGAGRPHAPALAGATLCALTLT